MPHLTTEPEPSNRSRLAGPAFRGLLLLGILLVTLPAQTVVRRDERSKECVMCHITWGDDWAKLEAILPEPGSHVTIDGYDERNGTREMCFSCHDGYVADDRALFGFLDQDAHLGAWDKAPKNLELRLDNDGQLYCGTCHSPHDHKMGRKYSYEPFMRRDIDRSQLCLECHQDHTGASSHPLHQPLPDGVVITGAPEETAGRVECLSCHQFHSASHLRLAPKEPVASLCITCHQDQGNIRNGSHDLTRLAENPEADACMGCHSVHDATGQDLWARDLKGVSVTPGQDARCLECHSETGLGKAHVHQDWGHPLGVDAPLNAKGKLPLMAGTVTCVSCHNPHRGAEGGSSDTSFLRGDGSTAGLCITCHEDQGRVRQSPHGPDGPGFLAARSALDTATNTADSSTPASSWDCLLCHNSHGEQRYSLVSADAPSPASGLCLGCHSPHASSSLADRLQEGPGSVGRFSHPLGDPAGGQVQPDQDANATVGCTTCHDPHRWSPAGLSWTAAEDGDEGSSFLRLDNRQGQLCLACHSEQQHAVNGPHRAAAPAGASTCVGCHTPHNAAQDGLMQTRASVTDRSALLASSPWPKGGPEWNPQSWNDGDRACLACHSDPALHERVPAAWAHPRVTLSEQGQARADKEGSQPVTCVTCHDPHLEQAGLISRPSSETPCASCHGNEALWRYRYYHDPERRKP